MIDGVESTPVCETSSILHDLALVGHRFESLADLRHSGSRYENAVPVLLAWLPRVKDPKMKAEIVRALSVPWAKAAVRPLIDEFRNIDPTADPTGTGLRWTVGNALSVIADDAVFDDLADLARDRRYGLARQMVVVSLGRSKREDAVNVLLELLDDDDVDGQAVKALGKLKPKSARTALEGKLDDKRAWVRREARKALAKLP